MKRIFLIHTILELIGGLVLIFRPDWMFFGRDLEPVTLSMIKIFGTLVFVFGVICFFIWQRADAFTGFKKTFLVVALYHFLVAIQLYHLFTYGLMGHPGSFIIHFSLSLLMLATYLVEVKK